VLMNGDDAFVGVVAVEMRVHLIGAFLQEKLLTKKQKGERLLEIQAVFR
jgi:hypothetical protein